MLTSNELDAIAIFLRLLSLVFAVIAGAQFQKAGDTNSVKEVIYGATCFIIAVASSGMSIALSR